MFDFHKSMIDRRQLQDDVAEFARKNPKVFYRVIGSKFGISSELARYYAKKKGVCRYKNRAADKGASHKASSGRKGRQTRSHN